MNLLEEGSGGWTGLNWLTMAHVAGILVNVVTIITTV
jgi:hypothetical protein